MGGRRGRGIERNRQTNIEGMQETESERHREIV